VRLGEHALHVSGFRDIALDCRGLAAPAGDFRHRLVGVFPAARVIHNHASPRGRQFARDFGADPFRRTRDDRDLVRKLPHCTPSPLR
jgi:hypothetical protein